MEIVYDLDHTGIYERTCILSGPCDFCRIHMVRTLPIVDLLSVGVKG